MRRANSRVYWRAVASYSYLKRQQRQNAGTKLRTVDENDKPLLEIVLP